ncbi:uncharacterized protein TRAVEDRAFT_54730, partial [Trametes versicolor FP-101664 SS1]
MAPNAFTLSVRYTAPCDVFVVFHGDDAEDAFLRTCVQLFFVQLDDHVGPQLLLCIYSVTDGQYALFCSNLTPIDTVHLREM